MKPPLLWTLRLVAYVVGCFLMLASVLATGWLPVVPPLYLVATAPLGFVVLVSILVSDVRDWRPGFGLRALLNALAPGSLLYWSRRPAPEGSVFIVIFGSTMLAGALIPLEEHELLSGPRFPAVVFCWLATLGLVVALPLRVRRVERVSTK